MTSETLASSVLTSEAALVTSHNLSHLAHDSRDVHTPGGAVFKAYWRGHSIRETLRNDAEVAVPGQ